MRYVRFYGQYLIYYTHVYNPPTLWSGVFDHSCGGGFLPHTPIRPGALPGCPQNFSPFWRNGPSVDPFGQNGA